MTTPPPRWYSDRVKTDEPCDNPRCVLCHPRRNWRIPAAWFAVGALTLAFWAYAFPWIVERAARWIVLAR